MEKLSQLAYHPLKMQSCYEKMEPLRLDGLQQRFDVSSTSVFKQRAQIHMREVGQRLLPPTPRPSPSHSPHLPGELPPRAHPPLLRPAPTPARVFGAPASAHLANWNSPFSLSLETPPSVQPSLPYSQALPAGPRACFLCP